MSKVSDNLTITSVQARKAVLKAFQAKRPIFLWGPPGIGKSEVVQEISDELGGFVIDLRMAQMEPTDIRGIPYFNKDINKMDWAAPVDLPDEEFAKQYPVVVLFLDEMNSAPPAVQAAGYQLILNRRVGKYRLPDNVVLHIACRCPSLIVSCTWKCEPTLLHGRTGLLTKAFTRTWLVTCLLQNKTCTNSILSLQAEHSLLPVLGYSCLTC
jgi:hypothetical protein